MNDTPRRSLRQRTRVVLLAVLTAATLAGPALVLAPAANAGPCQPVCPEPGPGTENPQPHPPNVKNRVTITRVDVLATHESSGSDRVKLQFDGGVAFFAHMGSNTSAFPNASRDIIGVAGLYMGPISAYEVDNWPSTNNFVGDIALFATTSSFGPRTADVRGAGAHYRITYTVQRIP